MFSKLLLAFLSPCIYFLFLCLFILFSFSQVQTFIHLFIYILHGLSVLLLFSSPQFTLHTQPHDNFYFDQVYASHKCRTVNI